MYAIKVKQITGPGWMHETSARTWCSGRTWRERVGREVGGRIGMGKTCKLKDVSFQCMTKFTTNKKNNKIKFKKKKKEGKHPIQLQPFCTHTNNDTRDSGSIPGLGISSGVGNGNMLQYSCLENSMNRGAWQAIVHKAAKSWT